MDTNNDQGLCVKELEFALQAVGYNPTGEEMEGFMTQFDNDGDKRLSFEEFITFMESVQSQCGTPEDQEEGLYEAFKQYDTDGSGFLEPDEFKKLMCEDATEEEVKELMAFADTDGDGKVNIKELSKVLAKLV